MGVANPRVLVMAAVRSIIICLGCGTATKRSSDRRYLYSSASSHVLPLWSSTITTQLKQSHPQLELDSLLAEVGRPYLCRKCFYGYEKVLKGTEAIKENMNKALEEVLPLADNTDSSESLPPPAKKRRQPLQPQSLITSGSPSVSVSIISLPMP